MSLTNKTTGVGRSDYKGRFFMLLLLAFVATIDFRLKLKDGGGTAILELLSFGFFGLVFLDAVIVPKQVSKRIDRALQQNWVVFSYFVWVGLAALVGVSRSIDGIWTFRNLLPSFLIYLAVLYSVDKFEQFGSLFKFYSGGLAISLTLGVSQRLFGGPYPNALHEGVLAKMDLDGNIVSNLSTGFFVHPNGFGIFLVPVTIFCVFSLTRNYFRTIWQKIFLSAYLILVLFNFWNTQTKGAWAWTAIGLALAYLPRIFDRMRFGISVSVLCTSIVGMVWFSMHSSAQGLRTLGSMQTRMELWRAGIKTIMGDQFVLWFGNGFQSMHNASIRMAELVYSNAHNNLINQVLYFGLPALLLMITLFLVTLARLSKLIEIAEGKQRTLAISLFVSLIALFGEHFFEPVTDSVVLQAQFFMLLGLAEAMVRMAPQNQPAKKPWEDESFGRRTPLMSSGGAR